jgi:hypothetical protein
MKGRALIEGMACSMYGRDKICKPDVKTPQEKHRHGWNDDIKVDLKDTRSEDVD